MSLPLGRSGGHHRRSCRFVSQRWRPSGRFLLAAAACSLGRASGASLTPTEPRDCAAHAEEPGRYAALVEHLCSQWAADKARVGVRAAGEATLPYVPLAKRCEAWRRGQQCVAHGRMLVVFLGASSANYTVLASVHLCHPRAFVPYQPPPAA